MLQGERVLKEPQVRLLAGECLLPVEAPAHQGGVARGVQDAREALGEEGAFEVLRVEAHPRDPREDLSRGAPAVLAPLVGEVALGVVVRDEPVVGLDEFRPARSEEHTSELQSRQYLVCRLLLEKKKKQKTSQSCIKILFYRIFQILIKNPYNSTSKTVY